MSLTGHASDDEEAYPCLKQYAADGDDWLFSHVPTSRHAKAQKCRPQAAARPAAVPASSAAAAAAAPSGPAVRRRRSSANAAPSPASGQFLLTCFCLSLVSTCLRFGSLILVLLKWQRVVLSFVCPDMLRVNHACKGDDWMYRCMRGCLTLAQGSD